jgi:hypothetical protein
MKTNRFILSLVIGCCVSSALVAQDNPNPLSAADRAFAEKPAAQELVRQDASVGQANEPAPRKGEAEHDPVNKPVQGLQAREQGQGIEEYKRPAGFQDRLRNVIRRASGPGTGRTLVIRSSELDPKEQANLEEDLVVMSRVLEKMLGGALGPQANANPVLGIDVFFNPGSNPIRSLYLDGYGALFTLNVSFPLTPSAKNDGEKEKPRVDSAWDEARQELYGQRIDGKRVYVRGEEYDERKVNRLKDALLEALRNATHIRGLKADDSVTICVSGGPSPADDESTERLRGDLENLHKLLVELLTRYTDTYPTVINTRERISALESQLADDQPKQPRGTMLTVRAKKSDVDSFAKDKMSLEDFRRKAKVVSYVSAIEPTAGTGGFGSGVSGGAGYGTSSRF